MAPPVAAAGCGLSGFGGVAADAVLGVEEGVWLHSDNGGQETACVFIQHLLQKFDFAPAVAFEWSHDCSKPRTDAYGGGAAFITATEIETMTTHEWLSKLAC